MNDAKNPFEPLAGYGLDLLAKMRNLPFTPHSLTKLHNIRTARNLSGSKTIIEIGTFRGVTAKRLSYIFDRVITVEIDEALYLYAQQRCVGRKNIEFHLGDGSVLLPQIITKEKEVLLFLDGHFSGGETGHGAEPEPVLKELDILASYLDRISAVVIDDFRLFGVEPGWPAKSLLLAKLEEKFAQKTWTITVMNDQVLVYRKLRN